MTTPDNDTKSNPLELPTLRQNAIPLKLHQLHSRQQDALLSAIQVIRSYAQEACNPSKDDDIHPDLQVGKLANVLFIDGKRGSGKSSILLSLIQSTYSPKGKDWFVKDSQGEERKESFSTKISALHKATDIQWLKPLDLELLPDDSNLLAAILVRLEDVFKQVTPDKSQGTHEYLLYPKNDKSPLERFNKLMNDVSLGWDSQLMSRRSSDPDSYSQELRRTELARFNIRNFNTILADMAEFYTTQIQHKKTPLFILPVDDADLNPTRYAELFKLIRMLPARNLFFVISGNYDNFKDLFEFGFLADFQKLTQGFGANKDYPHHRVMALASQLGYAARRKNLPSGAHHVQVEPFSVWEAANFRPYNLLGNIPESNLTLKWLLCQITLPRDTPQNKHLYRDYVSPAQNLWELMTLQKGATPDIPETIESSRYWPQTAYLMAGPPRAVFDLWLDVYQLYTQYFKGKNADEYDEQQLDAIIKFVELAFQECIDAEPSLPHNIKEQLRSLFLATAKRPMYRYTNQSVKIEALELVQVYEYDKSNEPNSIYSKSSLTQLKISKIQKISISVLDNEINKRFFVNDFRASWIFLLHDIMLLKPGNTIERLNLSKVCQGISRSTILPYRFDPALLNWPTPEWFTFFDLLSFTSNWNRLLNLKMIDGALSVQFAFNLWFYLVNSIRNRRLNRDLWACSIGEIDNYMKKSSKNNIYKDLEMIFHAFENNSNNIKIEGLEDIRINFLVIYSPEFGVFQEKLKKEAIKMLDVIKFGYSALSIINNRVESFILKNIKADLMAETNLRYMSLWREFYQENKQIERHLYEQQEEVPSMKLGDVLKMVEENILPDKGEREKLIEKIESSYRE